MVLTTALPGLVLDALGPEEAGTFYDLLQRNRDHLTALGDFVDDVAAPPEKWVAEFALPDTEGGRFGLFLDRRLIGRLDLVAVDPPKYSIGYWLDAGHIGRGYAKAALTSLLAFAQDELGASDIYAGVTHGNVRSEALLARLGFVPVERFERYTRFHLAT